MTTTSRKPVVPALFAALSATAVHATPPATTPCNITAEPAAAARGTFVRVSGTCEGILYHRYVRVFLGGDQVARFDGVTRHYGTSFVVPLDARPGRVDLTLMAPFATATTSFEVTGQAAPCPGDCDLDGRVSVDELLTGVSIALQRTAAENCAAIDRDEDGAASISELIAATDAALVGCARVERCRDSSVCTAPLSCRVPDDPELGGCETDGDCDSGDYCDRTGHCVPRSCRSFLDCPPRHHCVRVTGSSLRRCEHNGCIFDCGEDPCVNGFCAHSLGTCRD